jgi:mannose-6-phosphate isomerase-like protein (cupin superfamily)
MDHTAVPELLDSLTDDVDDPHYHEFLRRESLSVGLYRLPAGVVDPQEPHTEDEVYYVVSGRATIEVADESTAVEAGDVVFVERGVDHRFVDIEEELVVLVLFAPAEGTAGE